MTTKVTKPKHPYIAGRAALKPAAAPGERKHRVEIHANSITLRVSK